MKRAVPYLIHVWFAVGAAFGVTVFHASGEPSEQRYGLGLLVICGLGSVTVPILWWLDTWRRER